MSTSVKWLDELTFVGETESGHSLVMSADTKNSPSPMELVVLGFGGCSSIDVVSILKKGRHDVQDCVAQISYERAETTPRVFTKIHLNFLVTGKELSDKAVERAVALSMDKYCSVTKMLSGNVEITYGFEVTNVT